MPQNDDLGGSQIHALYRQGSLLLAPHPDFVFGKPSAQRSLEEPLLAVYSGCVRGVDEAVYFLDDDEECLVGTDMLDLPGSKLLYLFLEPS